MLTPSPEHNELHPYLAPHQNLELVYRTDYEARNSNEPLIPFPKGATLATYWFEEDKIFFFAESQWGILQIKPNKVKHTIWKSLDAIKAQAVNAPHTVQILGDLRSPIEWHTVMLLTKGNNMNSAHSNSSLIPEPADAEMAAVFPHEPPCFYKQVGDTVFAKDIQDTSWIPTNWVSLDDLKEHVQRNKYTYWVRNTPEVHECMDKIKPSSTESTFRTASEIADAALQHIKERATTYDSPEGERSALKTAQAFNAITGKNITEAEVFLLLQILKDVRQWQVPYKTHKDSIEDCIAYAALKAEAIEWQNTDPFYGLF